MPQEKSRRAIYKEYKHQWEDESHFPICLRSGDEFTRVAAETLLRHSPCHREQVASLLAAGKPLEIELNLTNPRLLKPVVLWWHFGPSPVSLRVLPGLMAAARELGDDSLAELILKACIDGDVLQNARDHELTDIARAAHVHSFRDVLFKSCTPILSSSETLMML